MADEVFTVKVEGLRELKTALRELPDATARNVLRRVGRKALEPMADDARELVPVEFGDLKRSITISSTLNRHQRRKHKTDDRDSVRIFMGAGSLPRAHLQEFGTSRHPAQPFMRPAWDKGHGRLLADIKHHLWLEIQAASKRLARKAARAAAKAAAGGM